MPRQRVSSLAREVEEDESRSLSFVPLVPEEMEKRNLDS